MSLVLPEHQALLEATLTLSNTGGDFFLKRTVGIEVTDDTLTAVKTMNLMLGNVGTIARTSNVQEEERIEVIVVYVKNIIMFCICYASHASKFPTVGVQ